VEFITTYAWVILVIVAALVIIYQSGIISPKTPPRKVMGFHQLVVKDFKFADAANEAQLTLLNDAGDNMQLAIDSITVAFGGSIPSCAGPAALTSLAPGATSLITASSCDFAQFSVGDYIEAEVWINYQNVESTNSHSSRGVIAGPLE